MTEAKQTKGISLFRFFSVASMIFGLNYFVSRVVFVQNNWEAFWYSIPALISEFCLVVNLYIISFIGWYRIDRTSTSFREVEKKFSRELWPTVSVLIPTLNEPISILRKNLEALTRLEYPKEKVSIFLLDDGARVEARELCEDLSAKGSPFFYLTRKRGVSQVSGAKAGNLNFALRSNQVKGEFIFLLDSDHTVKPHALLDLLPYFYRIDHENLTGIKLEENVGFVQSPDCSWDVENKLSFAEDTRCFYDALMKSFDAWGVVWLIGTSCLIRREMLDEIGGFDESTVTEDYATTIRIYGAQWKGRYHSEPISVGLPPVNLVSFLRQRQRWIEGGLQILLNAPKGIFKKISISHRLIFLSNPVSSVLKLICLPCFILHPLAYILGVIPYSVSSPIPFSLSVIPFYVLGRIQMMLLLRGVDLRALIRAEQFYTLTIPSVLVAAWRVCFRRGKLFFWVSPKDQKTLPRKRLEIYLSPLLLLGGLHGLALVRSTSVLCANRFSPGPWWNVIPFIWQVYFFICISPALFCRGSFPNQAQNLDRVKALKPQPLWKQASRFFIHPIQIAPAVMVIFYAHVLAHPYFRIQWEEQLGEVVDQLIERFKP